jgi:hypothetical protein
MEFEQIRLRVMSLNEDLKFADELTSKKLSYETRIFAILEQKADLDFQSPEMQSALEREELMAKKNIENTDNILKKVRLKILRSLGR